MKIISVASEKGGSGKTTTSFNLACELLHQGMGPVVVVDIDPLGSLKDYCEARVLPEPSYMLSEHKKLDTHLEWLATKGYKVAIIDTPPEATPRVQACLQASDLVIIPTGPSPLDLRALKTTIGMARQIAKPFIFVLAKVVPNTRLGTEAMMLLSQYGPVPAVFHNRQDWMLCTADGQSVRELDENSKSTFEVRRLALYIIEALGLTK